jgi:hypothetical protein
VLPSLLLQNAPAALLLLHIIWCGTFSCGSSSLPGTTCTATCSAGYKGSYSSVCGADGSWGSVTGDCTQSVTAEVVNQLPPRQASRCLGIVGGENVTRRHIRHTSMALPTGMVLAETLRWGIVHQCTTSCIELGSPSKLSLFGKRPEAWAASCSVLRPHTSMLLCSIFWMTCHAAVCSGSPAMAHPSVVTTTSLAAPASPPVVKATRAPQPLSAVPLGHGALLRVHAN